ncbi:hypothetical protein D6C76_08437 [Aureobasidium pullulans]|nr:hypothetical protein D6C76_08437 [Aureobasidium pullulans]
MATTIMQTTALLHPSPDIFDVNWDVVLVSDVILQITCSIHHVYVPDLACFKLGTGLEIAVLASRISRRGARCLCDNANAGDIAIDFLSLVQYGVALPGEALVLQTAVGPSPHGCEVNDTRGRGIGRIQVVNVSDQILDTAVQRSGSLSSAGSRSRGEEIVYLQIRGECNSKASR